MSIRAVFRVLLLLVCLAGALLAAQRPDTEPGPPQQDIKLPSGKSQRQEILKAEHQKSLHDVADIVKLSGELQSELQKNDYQVLSLSSLKKAEQIEKLARRIKDRLKR